MRWSRSQGTQGTRGAATPHCQSTLEPHLVLREGPLLLERCGAAANGAGAGRRQPGAEGDADVAGLRGAASAAAFGTSAPTRGGGSASQPGAHGCCLLTTHRSACLAAAVHARQAAPADAIVVAIGVVGQAGAGGSAEGGRGGGASQHMLRRGMSLYVPHLACSLCAGADALASHSPLQPAAHSPGAAAPAHTGACDVAWLAMVR